MLRATLVKSGSIRLEETLNPEPGRGEVRVRLAMTGICGSDVHLFHKGRPEHDPLTIGHEGLGRIDKTGPDVNPGRTGERIVIEPNIPCMTCPECLSGRGNICRNKRIIGVTENGCLAEYVIVPDSFAWSIPDSISDTDAVTIEPAAVALSAINRSGASPGDTILVIGLGAIGLLITHIALAFGYRVLVVEISENKTKIAVDMGAIPVGKGLNHEEVAERICQTCQEESVKSVFECAGSGKTASMAIKVAPRGSEVILLGLSDKPASFIPMDLAKKGILVSTSLIYDHPSGYEKTIFLVQQGIIHPGFIVSRYFSLKESQKALEEASKGKESKIVISMQQ
ncbi:MAG: alcohol dehydrogenase catalytic domain-containing protein [Bacteroidales bacterium]|nr:alcohol dehydrogenase catalytic domain-containing protein [Bacteroidales bacterium]